VRSGFVTIIGRPNAGKSTLLNSLVGEKLAIVTHKAQTTRSRITGIVNVKRQGKRPASQIVFVDTPGVHKPEDQLNKRMMQEVYDSLEGCDLILLIVDVTQKFGTGDEFVLVLPDFNVIEDSEKVMQQIVDKFCKPFYINAKQLIVTTSIGIAVYPNDGADEGTLLKNADIAMYQAKQAVRARYRVCNKD